MKCPERLPPARSVRHEGNVGKQKQLIPERPDGISPAVSASAKLW
jgi:hypothetical protein